MGFLKPTPLTSSSWKLQSPRKNWIVCYITSDIVCICCCDRRRSQWFKFRNTSLIGTSYGISCQDYHMWRMTRNNNPSPLCTSHRHYIPSVIVVRSRFFWDWRTSLANHSLDSASLVHHYGRITSSIENRMCHRWPPSGQVALHRTVRSASFDRKTYVTHTNGFHRG